MFVESEHPRDKEGKFTYKNGGVSSQNIEERLIFKYWFSEFMFFVPFGET